MTIEELYKLRQELLENKTKFSELNAKYNKLLSKINEKKGKEKKMTEEQFIKGKSYVRFWVRFLIFQILIFIFKMPDDMILLCIFGNLGMMVFDEKVILPNKWAKQNMRPAPESKEEKEQRELYEEVSQARTLYHQLNKKYETEFRKLSKNDEKEYLEYLESLGLSLDLEGKEEEEPSKEEESPIIPSSDIKMLNMAYEEQ